MHDAFSTLRMDIFVAGPHSQAAAANVAREIGVDGDVLPDDLAWVGHGWWVPALFRLPEANASEDVGPDSSVGVFPLAWMNQFEKSHPQECALALTRRNPPGVYSASAHLVLLHGVLPQALEDEQFDVHTTMKLRDWERLLGSPVQRPHPYGPPVAAEVKPVWRDAWCSEDQRAPCMEALLDKCSVRHSLKVWSRALFLNHAWSNPSGRVESPPRF